jgi:UDP-N-acetylmuramate--alanine ligase
MSPKDLTLENVKRVHCIGVGGIGLSALAQILLSKGYEVSGSDLNESHITDALIAGGAKIYLGHRAKHVADADLVVYSSAVQEENPEFAEAKERKIPMVSRAELLGYFMRRAEDSIAITGVHGKTTTTAMISSIFLDAKRDPTILIGGNLDKIGGNYKVGRGGCFITEACEYMDSFLKLYPKNAVILNIDSDHLDYFSNIEQIVKSFRKFADLVPEDGAIYAYDANPFVAEIIKAHGSKTITFGFKDDCNYYSEKIDFSKDGYPSFNVMKGGKKLARVSLNIPGEHNIINALASFSVAHNLGIEEAKIAKTLNKFTGVKRRFDKIGETKSGAEIIDDYAHHPNEIKATIKAIKNIPHKKLWCVFQPHTYTRTLALAKQFAKELSAADRIVLAKIYPARERNANNISSRIILDEFPKKIREKNAIYIDSFDKIAKYVHANAAAGDLIMTMGAGDIFEVGEMIIGLDEGGEKTEPEAIKRGVKIND